MGFWSKLAKGLAIGGAGLGTVLTAGAASPTLAGALGLGAGTAAAGGAAATAGSGILSKIAKGASAASKIAGPIASGLASGAQKGREGENTAAADAARFKLSESTAHETGLENRAQLDLSRRADARTGQSDAYNKALKSALGMNVKDFEIDPSSLPRGVSLLKTSGGLRPSAMGPEGRAAHELMNKQAMAKLLAGEHYDELPPMERTAPGEFKKPGVLENVAGAVGMGANAINANNASNEQMSMQERIAKAIESIGGGGGVAGPAPVPPPNVGVGLSGVKPFTKPPTATFPIDPYGVDSSNR